MTFPSPLVVATHSPGKRREFARLLGSMDVDAISAESVNVPEPDEPANTFVGNAVIKAQHAARIAGIPALADDTGMCVDAMGGAPGVQTKRWAMARGGWAAACEAICRDVGLIDVQSSAAGPFRASFVCAMALAWPSAPGIAPVTLVARGEASGQLRWPPHDGPGFVPVFGADDADRFVIDDVYAHRRAAFTALADRLRQFSGR